jgi:hypothetical protein
MKTLTRFILIVAALTMAPLLYADRPNIQYKELPEFPDDPTITSCIAFSLYGQKCKECTGHFDEAGNHTTECKSRQYHSGCTCTSYGTYCDWRGECMYH